MSAQLSQRRLSFEPGTNNGAYVVCAECLTRLGLPAPMLQVVVHHLGKDSHGLEYSSPLHTKEIPR